MIANLRKTQTWCLFLGALALLSVPTPDAYGQGLIPSAAQKAVARRQELIAKADDAGLRGQRYMADKDYEQAVSEFKKALDLLPDAPVVQARREEYTSQYADASVQLGRQRAQEGRYPEAITLVTAVLDPTVDPENEEARRLLEDLNDPEIYSPAITPEHIARVKKVEQALKVAESYIRIGDYDSAEKKYFEALNFDPYNSAARRGLEELERHRRIYHDTAYDQTRATFLRQIAEQWELEVPRFGIEGSGEEAGPEPLVTGQEYIQEKLKRIRIPEIEFEDTPLTDAIEFLRIKSIELDELEPDPSLKGINFILRTGGGGGGGGGGGAVADDLGFGDPAGGGDDFGGGDSSGSPPITLKLSNVPLIEALRYTTELARLKFKVEANAVVIIPLTEITDDLFTQTFRVPPSFITSGGGGGGGAPADDPFADLGDGGGGGGLERRKGAQEILGDAGVSFPPGSSAIYNATTSQLIVRNTGSNIELVDAFIASLYEEVQKQIYITTKFVEIRQQDNKQLGFDWLLGQANIPGSDRIFGGGGTLGTARAENSINDFPFVAPGSTQPFGDFPLTSGLRTGTLAVNQGSIDSLLANTVQGQSNLAPAVLSVAGIFTDPQYQFVIRALSQHNGTDLLSAPSVVARSGQRAKVEVVREFMYPSEYDPPEIPDNFSGGGNNNNQPAGGILGGGATINSFPVTPANPAAFDVRNVGVTLEVDPVIGADGFTIDLNLNPEVVEFEGFINYGSPINTGGVANGVPVQIQLTENRIEMPIFATRRVTTAVTIWDGQTVAIGGLIREDVQKVEDKIPLLGDIPFAGFLFRSEVDVRLKRNLTVFVTARLIDPAGFPINADVSGKVAIDSTE